MGVIEMIKTKLQNYPQAKYESNDHSVKVFPRNENGFTVSLFLNEGDYTVSFNGWHENFQTAEEALNCFAFGLSSDCRLKEYVRGGFAYKWHLEHKVDSIWVKESETGLFFFPFWRKLEIRYLQNDLIGD